MKGIFEKIRRLANEIYGERKKNTEKSYETVYGKERYREKLEKDRRSVKKMYIFLLAVFALAVFADIMHTVRPGVEIKYGRSGEAVEIVRPQKGAGSKSIGMRITAVSGSGSTVSSQDVTIRERGISSAEKTSGISGQETEEERLQRKISSVSRSLNDDTEKAVIKLPERTDDGITLHWHTETKSSLPAVICLLVLAAAMIRRSGTSKVRKAEKKARESIIRELPGFLNTMVLLLNAGVVFESAFVRAVEDRIEADHENENYFYEQMKDIYVRMKETNASAVSGIAGFAKRSGVREMMRISAVISDNIGKGSALSEKLSRESRMMWFMRKKQSEEKGRIAETKMTLPLMILLLVLILIAVAPAMLDM